MNADISMALIPGIRKWEHLFVLSREILQRELVWRKKVYFYIADDRIFG